ncbi:hypothetical protein TNCV_568461 [Trichonephila clavipes]|nr:hypothetical protein TNCV_568461 [Trichonephila clavipes]
MYSRDFAPDDFYLYLKMKNAFMGTYFQPVDENAFCDEMKAKMADLVKMLSPNESQNCFEQWKNRMQLCSVRQGEYVKGD